MRKKLNYYAITHRCNNKLLTILFAEGFLLLWSKSWFWIWNRKYIDRWSLCHIILRPQNCIADSRFWQWDIWPLFLTCNKQLLRKLNTKSYQFTKLCKSDWVTYPKQQKSIFFQKSCRIELMAFSTVRSINYSEKKIFCCFGYVTQSLLHSFVNW